MRQLSGLLLGVALIGIAACASSSQGGDADAGIQTCETSGDCVDDGEFCNGGLICRDNVCMPTDPPLCSDGVSCTVDGCDESLLGCVNVPNDSLCDDGLVCNPGEGCGTPPDCEFADDCKDDGFICNGSPECLEGECSIVPLDCSDTDACTVDLCVEAVGCTNDPADFESDVDHCTAACTPCPEPTAEQEHVVRVCENAICGFVCEAGYWDVDSVMANGCEIACPNDPSTTTDVPDDGFEDQNCDGIDGTVEDGIFVAEDGSNANPGTMAFPVKTISTGFTKALAAGKTFLFISAGNYDETVTINATNQGIGLHGGYLRSSGWARDGTRGVIIGPRTGALRVNSVSTTTIVEYLQIVGASATVPSTSSHAIVVTGSTGFRPRYLTASAGNGAAGVQGSSAGSVGDDGGNGVPGSAGYEDDGYFYCAGNQADPALTYAGGDSCSSGSTRGGDGKRGCITNGSACAGTDGDAGSPNPGGSYSDQGYGVSGSTGGSGQNGRDGTNGTNGSAGSGGYLSGTEWVPYNGGNGLEGGDGSGGGGGAGGGSNHSSGTCNDWGGGGGGGGGGGCGGTGGDGGTGGGSSIAILLSSSTVTAESVDVITGNGGDGGAGRSGGNGGPGGLGRSGGGGNDESRAGGSGGNGGAGARGGHGGGGAGGWVIGVYRSSSTWNDGGTTDPTLGTVGNGGSSSGNSGAAGSAVPIT